MLTYDLADRGEQSLYESLYRHIRDDILRGNLRPDDRLPSKRGFAEHLGVSVITVEGAYRQLAAEGYVSARERSGYYVRPISAPPHMEAIHSARKEQVRRPYAVADFTSASAGADPSFARLWEKTLRDTISNEPERELFAAQPAQGTGRLREALAAWLAHARGMAVDPDRIVIAAGAPLLYGLVALLQKKGGPIALESPGYRRLQSIYETMGTPVVAVPLDGEGIDMSELDKSGASLVHVMPSHQFPTGIVTSVSRRYELLGWASRTTGRYIVEDDYDWEFRLAGKPIPSLGSIDVEGRVIYLSTFSKSLSPALRIAFGVFPPALDDSLERVLRCFSSTVGTIEQTTLARLMESGEYERHVNRYRNKSRNARDWLLEALRTCPAADKFSFEECDSGLHFVLCVDTCAKAVDIARQAAENGVGLAPIERYDMGAMRVSDGSARFVMQYDGVDPESFERAAAIICAAMELSERRCRV